MFEEMTYEAIMNNLLSSVSDNYDKREGSVIWDALAPAAAEIAQAYIALDGVLNESFAGTASLEFLKKRCAERGISQYPATNAILKAEFTPSGISIPIGSRFSCGSLNYTVTDIITSGTYKVKCESLGSEGNSVFGQLLPIDYIAGLQTAMLTELLIPAEDAEDVEHLRKRYFDSVSTQAFGGNIADYIQKTESISGVGGCKVIPAWNGGGTVKLIIMDSAYGIPSSEVISVVKETIDPSSNSGKGYGLAPIGHVVTVVGVSGLKINITANITYQSGWSWASASSYIKKAIDDYLTDLCQDWSSSESMIVRTSRIEQAILDSTGVADVDTVQVNGQTRNITLPADQIPIRGTINGSN